MAIYHASVKVIGRSQGRSATAAAAYRAGCCIDDDRTGTKHDYTKKQGVDYATIVAPENAPAWALDRAQLWNAVEMSERRKDSQLCREIEVAIPQELDRADMIALAVGFAKSECVKLGMIADVCLHDLDSPNPHAHILLTMRKIGPDGFGEKNRDWNSADQLAHWRQAWADRTNAALENAGIDKRIDHRSNATRGIDRVPTIHEGAAARRMAERGQHSDRIAENDRRRALNAHLESCEIVTAGLAPKTTMRPVLADRMRALEDVIRREHPGYFVPPARTPKPKPSAKPVRDAIARRDAAQAACEKSMLYAAWVMIGSPKRLTPRLAREADEAERRAIAIRAELVERRQKWEADERRAVAEHIEAIAAARAAHSDQVKTWSDERVRAAEALRKLKRIRASDVRGAPARVHPDSIRLPAYQPPQPQQQHQRVRSRGPSMGM